MTARSGTGTGGGSALPFALVAAPRLTVHAGGTVTHHDPGALHQRIGDFSSKLDGLGIATGTLLAMALPDPVDQVVGFLGAIAAGVVPCLLPPPGMTDEESHWSTRALVMSGPDLDSATLDGRARILDDALYVQRTSGTGRQAEAIVISREVATASVLSAARRLSDGVGDVTVGWLPLHHDYGLMCQLLLPMAIDGTTVLISPIDWLHDPALLLEVVSEVGGTHTYMPAFGFRRCVDRIDPEANYDLSSWRFLNCAGEPVPAGLLPEFETLCRPWGLRPGAVAVAYGMAEVVAGATITPIGEGYRIDTVVESALTGDGRAVPAPRGRRFVSCGPALDCLECSVVSPDGAPLPERAVGEIALRGPTLGRLLTETGTEPLSTTADGWFRSGDVGYVADGEVYVVDRVKDLIIVGGVNIHPSRVEDTARDAVPAVRRAAAFGVSDAATATERPVLLLERPRAPLNEARALRDVRRALLGIGIATHDIRFVDQGAIAVTTSGKVRRQFTRDGYLALLAGTPAGAAPTADWLAVVRDVTGVEALDPHTTVEELGVDSLAVYELLTALETALDVTIDDRALTSVSTVADLGRLAGETLDGTWPPPVDDRRGPAPRPHRPRTRWRAQLRRGPVVGPVHLPLRLGTPLHGAAASLRLRTAGDSIKALREVVGLAETIGLRDVDEVARISVIANSWQPWRWTATRPELARAVARGDAAYARRPGARPALQVLGGSHLADAVTTGRGVVLVAPHVAIAPILSELPQLDGRRVLTLDARGTTAVDRTRQLRDAHRTLRAGGAMLILADEFSGDGGITIDVGGKERPLRPGFARLALATESEVVPVFPSFDADGRLTIDVRACMGAATEHALLVDFGDLLRAFWHEHTGSLSWYIVRRHLNYSG